MQHQLTTAELQYLTKKLSADISSEEWVVLSNAREITYFYNKAEKGTAGGERAFKYLNDYRIRYRECKKRLNKLRNIQTKLKRQLAEQAKQEQEANSWIVWEGGECPVDTRVDVKLSAGTVYSNVVAQLLDWYHLGAEGDIIAYRIHKPK